MKDEKVIDQMANLADLPPDGGPLRDTLIQIYRALRAGDISWEVVVREMQEIRRDQEHYQWTPIVRPRAVHERRSGKDRRNRVRRSGKDRRKKRIPIDLMDRRRSRDQRQVDRRTGKDRREGNEQ